MSKTDEKQRGNSLEMGCGKQFSVALMQPLCHLLNMPNHQTLWYCFLMDIITDEYCIAQQQGQHL